MKFDKMEKIAEKIYSENTTYLENCVATYIPTLDELKIVMYMRKQKSKSAVSKIINILFKKYKKYSDVLFAAYGNDGLYFRLDSHGHMNTIIFYTGKKHVDTDFLMYYLIDKLT